MSKISLDLPTIQNWNCHNCGQCCHQHGIFISENDHQRIVDQNWRGPDGIPDEQPLFVEEKTPFSKSWRRLAHQPNGACVFLDEKGLCKIHARFGEEAKPLACRIYPYAFHPAGNKLAVSLRFSCPSVAGNLGKPVVRQRQELQSLAGQVVPKNFQDIPPPDFRPGVPLNWTDLLQICRKLEEGVTTPNTSVAVKLLRLMFWMDLVGKAKLDKIQGERLRELLDLLSSATVTEIPQLPDDSPPPTRIGRTQFRLLAGMYARKDTPSNIDITFRGRMRQLKSALQLASGWGTLTSPQPELSALPIEQVECIGGRLDEASEEMLTRYYQVKIHGLHFFGRAFYDVPLLEGFQSLMLTFPSILWIARWHAASRGRTTFEHADVLTALTIVDHQHGYSPAFGQWSFRARVRTLNQMEDLPRLVTWSVQLGNQREQEH